MASLGHQTAVGKQFCVPTVGSMQPIGLAGGLIALILQRKKGFRFRTGEVFLWLNSSISERITARNFVGPSVSRVAADIRLARPGSGVFLLGSLSDNLFAPSFRD